jgi:transcription initiation factor TFIIB
MGATTARNCPECDGQVRASGDETVCADCGLVVDSDRIDRGPEWRSFADEETSRERTGAPLTRSRHDRGLSTEVGNHGDTMRLKGRKRRRVARLRRQHKRTTIGSKADRNQVYAFTEIRRLVGALELPESVRESACTLFESAQDADLLRGRSLEGFAAAAVYATCRTRSISRSIDEVVDGARASREELTVAYDALNRELGLPTGPVDPREYIPRFASELDLPADVRRRAESLSAAAREEGVDTGRNPCGVAAACLYAAAEERGASLTQQDAADVADVTPVTLRSSYYDLPD